MIGDVDRTFGQDPRQPTVEGASAEVATLKVRCVGQDPLDFRCALVGSHCPTMLGLGHDALHHGAQVLPAQARANRFSRGPIPNDDAGPLIGDADGIDRRIDPG